jgi:transposase
VGFNFVTADRDQRFLLPPDMREWLPADHLAWFVIDVVDQLDLAAFERSYRADAHGRPPYDPAVMVGLLLYAYCLGVRSSRAIERRCVEDVAFRVVAGGLRPDHATIARFRSRHSAALAGLLVDSLRLCAQAGLVKLGVVALDGTKMSTDASPDRNRTLPSITRQVEVILAEAAALDAAEDSAPPVDGQRVPSGLVDPAARRRHLAAAKEQLEAAKARLEATAAAREAAFQARSEALNAARAAKGRPPRTFRRRRQDEAPQPDATTNLTDPDSKLLIARRGRVQGYNAQFVTTAEQIVVAARVTNDANDVDQLVPMAAATRNTLAAAGIHDPIQALVADAGYWKAANVNGSTPGLPRLFVVVAKHGRRGKPRQDGLASQSKTTHLVDAMNAQLATPEGQRFLRIRRTSVEPVFGHTKHIRGITGFVRRGRNAADQEWRSAHSLGRWIRRTYARCSRLDVLKV